MRAKPPHPTGYSCNNAGGEGHGRRCGPRKRVLGDRCGGPRGEAVTGRLAGRGPRPALRRPGGRRRRTRPWARWLPGAARSRPRLPERHDQPIADRHQRADPRWTAREGARESPHALGRRRPVGRVEDPSTPEHVVHDQQAAGRRRRRVVAQRQRPARRTRRPGAPAASGR